MSKKDLAVASFNAGILIFGFFLAYISVPLLIVLLTGTLSSFYKAAFIWQIIATVSYSGYISYKYAPDNEIIGSEDKSDHGSN